jgi:hypothetical protein
MSKLEVNAVEPQCGTNLTLGASGDTVIIPSGATISNQGTAAGFGPTGAVSWNTTKITADPNPAVSGVGYFADTTSSAFTVTLPAAPSAGDIVALSDYTGTWATNNITVGRNSSNINGAASDLILNQSNTTATLIYVDATEGWRVIDTGSLNEVNGIEFVVATGGTVTCCGDYKIHTFTGPGTFTVTSVGNPLGSDKIQFLAVAGGGAGGSDNGGGGGGGSVVKGSCEPVSVQAYPIAIGGGGAGSPGVGGSPGGAGDNTTFKGITVLKGGGGRTSCGGTSPGSPFGNGGGGAGVSASTSGCAGSANTPIPANSTTFGANSGGDGTNNTCSVYRSGGGGGAGGNGNPGLAIPTYSIGGAGVPDNICGSTYFYGGGGGGGVFCSTAGAGGTGGAGGGGGGSSPTGGTGGAAGIDGRNPGTAGQPFPTGGKGGNAGINTGSGGGGGGRAAPCAGGGNGGSGIVIIKYKFQN